MGYAAIIALVGLVFGMISIKLMSAVENAQVVLVGRINSRRQSQKEKGKIVALAISARKLFALRIGVAFFGKISSIIFVAEAMYPEKVVEGAALAVMKTIMFSNQIRIVTSKHGKYAVKKIKTKYRRNFKRKLN